MNHLWRFVLCCTFLYAGFISAQHPVELMRVPSLQLHALSLRQPDPLSFKHNQAFLAAIDSFAAGAFIQQRYAIKEWRELAGSVALVTPYGNFGLQLQYVEAGVYRERLVGLAYAKKYGNLCIGSQVSHYSNAVPSYTSVSGVLAEVGVAFRINELFCGTIHLLNPFQLSNNSKEMPRFSSRFTMGWLYDASRDFQFGISILKDGALLTVIPVFKYDFANRFWLRGGFDSKSRLILSGAGLQLKRFRINVYCTIHQQLGISTGLSWVYAQG